MELPAGLKPRHLIGILGILVVTALMFNGTVGSEAGLAVLIGIFAALGAYSMGVRKHKQ